MADTPARPMKYPYTLSAKIAQFPFKFYYDKVWMFRYWTYSLVLCVPIFYKIQCMARTPENIQKWSEIRRKEFSGKSH